MLARQDTGDQRFGDDILYSESLRIASIDSGINPDAKAQNINESLLCSSESKESILSDTQEQNSDNFTSQENRYLFLTIGYRACNVNLMHAPALTVSTGILAVGLISTRAFVPAVITIAFSCTLGLVWGCSLKGKKYCESELLKIDSSRTPGSLSSIWKK